MEINLPSRFRAYRDERRITQDELGNRLGITGKYVGMIERGEKQVDADSSMVRLFALLEKSSLTEEDRRIHAPRPRIKEDLAPYGAADAVEQTLMKLRYVLERGTRQEQRLAERMIDALWQTVAEEDLRGGDDRD